MSFERFSAGTSKIESGGISANDKSPEDVNEGDYSALEKIIENRNVSRLSLEREEYKKEVLAERKIGVLSKYEDTLRRLLCRYGVDVPIKKIGRRLFQIDLDGNDWSGPKLPPGYGYEGGAARASLERKLGIDKSAKPRDLDIIYLGSNENLNVSDEIAKRLSPDDYKINKREGWPVVENDVSDYFETRDFTINELLLVPGKIILTKECLLDSVRGILRITEFERGKDNIEYPHIMRSKLLAKALRLTAEAGWLIEDGDKFDYQRVGLFSIGVQLGKAWSKGYEQAMKYVVFLRKKEIIPEYIASPDDLADYVEEQDGFLVRRSPKGLVEREVDFIEEELSLIPKYNKYENLPSFEKVIAPSEKRKEK